MSIINGIMVDLQARHWVEPDVDADATGFGAGGFSLGAFQSLHSAVPFTVNIIVLSMAR